MAKNAIYYDASRCTACKGCQIICKSWNELPSPLEQTDWTGSYESPATNSGTTWLRMTFNEVDVDGGKVGWAFGRDACLHCTDAACASVCPAGAYKVTASGTVAFDESKCIHCQFCASACPFSVPKFDDDGLSRKCWMCQDRTAAGRAPACVTTCPAGALQYGDRAEMLAKAKERVAEIKGSRPNAVVYGEKELDGLHVISVLPYGAAAHGLPEKPAKSIMNTTESILRPLTLVGILGVTGVALASFIGGRGFNQAEALKHAYPGGASDDAADEAVAEEGGDA